MQDSRMEVSARRSNQTGVTDQAVVSVVVVQDGKHLLGRRLLQSGLQLQAANTPRKTA